MCRVTVPQTSPSRSWDMPPPAAEGALRWGVTLGSRGPRHPHQILTRGRQNMGVPETGRPRAACGEDGGVWARKGREPSLPGTPGALALPAPGFRTPKPRTVRESV